MDGPDMVDDRGDVVDLTKILGVAPQLHGVLGR